MKPEIEVKAGAVIVDITIKPFFGGEADADRALVYAGDIDFFESEDDFIKQLIETITHETLHAILFRDFDDDFEEIVSDVAAASVGAPAGMERGDVYYWLKYGKNVGDLFTLP